MRLATNQNFSGSSATEKASGGFSGFSNQSCVKPIIGRSSFPHSIGLSVLKICMAKVCAAMVTMGKSKKLFYENLIFSWYCGPLVANDYLTFRKWRV